MIRYKLRCLIWWIQQIDNLTRMYATDWETHIEVAFILIHRYMCVCVCGKKDL